MNVVVPDDATELYFFKLFITGVVVDELVYQTNLYASQYIDANTISQRSRIKKWPKDGITASDMKSYLGLTFYMGLVQKDNFKSYWSIDSVLLTPFVGNVMPRDSLNNLHSFFHLVDNSTYPKKGEPGYDPRKKLGSFYDVTSTFSAMYTPSQKLSIDEGTIGFKGRVSFKWYNPSKPQKYNLKTYKLVDSLICILEVALRKQK